MLGAAGGGGLISSAGTGSLPVTAGEASASPSLRAVPAVFSSPSGREGSFRIDGRETGFGLSPTRYSSTARFVMPAQSPRSFSTFSSLRWGARRPATLRLILPSARAASTWGKRRATFATWMRKGTEPSVNTRVKMGGTSNVIALVKADGKFYYTTKEVKVTIGGCGG